MSINVAGKYSAAPAKAYSIVWNTVFVIAGSMFIAICAHIAVPLPFSPVPMTLQPFAVILMGMMLGPVAGSAAAAAYLFEGLAGAPVFTTHGPGGLLQLLGPTGGYLMSYPFAAAIAGALFACRRTFFAGALAGTAAMALVFLSGAVWFATLTHAPAHAVWIASVAPFLPGEVVKICAAAGIASALPNFRN
ncbi:biotin transporter BioY [Terriglobus saanensis]|uniref:Biotin transporter n=1 Tax=Terriglobus saanensis (strain ATCC BAA-1853 / DSM 23119 / SP1PR4) TaxID=401053 RepID=E8V7B5_TERSS|nr:biotin transporter BioY [Terriglobus saanensis]ADV82828.1 BioY protein [Terriglobus saanensis SP1PR4]